MCFERTVANGKPMLEQVYPQGLQPVGRTHAGAGDKCEEEGVAERNCYGLTMAPIPHPPSTTRQGEVEELEMKE